MKLNHVITQRITSRIIRHFGQAKLVRLHNGRHELIGGSASDLIAAQEWVSLFAHEIVFSPKSVAKRTLAPGWDKIRRFKI